MSAAERIGLWVLTNLGLPDEPDSGTVDRVIDALGGSSVPDALAVLAPAFMPCDCGDGIFWPVAADGCNDHSFVERCDSCERYESDARAAVALATRLGCRIGVAQRSPIEGQEWDDEPHWFRAGASAEEIDASELWRPGYSLCVDREERA